MNERGFRNLASDAVRSSKTTRRLVAAPCTDGQLGARRPEAPRQSVRTVIGDRLGGSHWTRNLARDAAHVAAPAPKREIQRQAYHVNVSPRELD